MESSNVISDIFAASGELGEAHGHEAPRARLRALVTATQQPATCQRRCSLSGGYHGGALADVRRLAYALMFSVVHDCALVTNWPWHRRTSNFSSTLTTSADLRQRCYADNRLGLSCYFLPYSSCQILDKEVERTLPAARIFGLDSVNLDSTLDVLINRTGLRSETLIMGTLTSWIMRPQPELRAAIEQYGAAAGFATKGARHRRVAMHIRHGDKHSLYGRHLRNESWRVSADAFDAWGRRISADLGADKVVYMTDDPRVMDRLQRRAADDGLFRLVPAPRDCMPSYAMGLLGKHGTPIAGSLQALQRKPTVVARFAASASAACGPRYLVDDGIQLFAGVYLLAQCTAFIGTQISNLDAATVELMSTLRHPPTVYDVLNDVHRTCLSDEKVWWGGVHTNRRPLSSERMATGSGATTLGNNCKGYTRR